jgi:hypothetical protein
MPGGEPCSRLVNRHLTNHRCSACALLIDMFHTAMKICAAAVPSVISTGRNKRHGRICLEEQNLPFVAEAQDRTKAAFLTHQGGVLDYEDASSAYS